MLGLKVVAVKQVKVAGLDLTDDTLHSGVEIAEQEQHPVRRVLEHRPGVLGIEQRAQPGDRFGDRSLEEPQLEADLARLTGYVLIAGMAQAGDLDGGVGGVLLVHDVVGVVLEFQSLPGLDIHQVRGDRFLFPGHLQISLISTSVFPSRMA